MEIIKGLSGRILPDENEEKNRKNNWEVKNRFFRSCAVKKFNLAIFFLGIAAGAGLLFGASKLLFNENSGSELSAVKPQDLQKDAVSIDISSSPAGASLYFDGNALSKFTPSFVDNISDGSHLLQIFSGEERWEAELELKDGNISALNALISGGKLAESNSNGYNSIFLSSVPAGAKISINNKDIQKITPFEITGIHSGSYLLSLEKEGYAKWSEEISIENSKKIELTAILEAREEKNNSEKSGYRKYENSFYGIKADIPLGWKASELPKNIFAAAFSGCKDNKEYARADAVIVFLSDKYEKPAIAVSISPEEKSKIIGDFSGEDFKKLESESAEYGIDLFESLQKTERFAVIKSDANPYVFLISFSETSGSNKDFFNDFLVSLQISKPIFF